MDRRTAARLGLKSYYNDKPCKNGHTSGRYVSTGACIHCARDNTQRWQKRFVPAERMRFAVHPTAELGTLAAISAVFARHQQQGLLELSPPTSEPLDNGMLLVSVAVPEALRAELAALLTAAN